MFPAEAATDADHPPSATESSVQAVDHDVLSSVCHDLKAPLASIVMGLGFLRTLLDPEAAALRVVESMHRSAGRMNELIERFHDLGRLQSGGVTLTAQPHDVRALATVAFEQYVRQAEEQGVSRTLELGPELDGATIPCDRARILQSLQLLVSCALKALPEGWALALRANAGAPGEVCFGLVARRGGPAVRPVVVELPKAELTIARGLIELSGGRLEAKVGSDELAFALVLPRTPTP